MRPIVIVAPNYKHTSNGIRALHDLCHIINALGHTARMLILKENEIVGAGSTAQLTNPEWNTPLLEETEQQLIADGIVIYPEVVNGNPLDAPRVARFMGNKEGVLRSGEGMAASREDFIIAHSKVINPNADFILYYSYVNPVFNDLNTNPEARAMNGTYIGKGYMYAPEVGIIRNTFFVEREYPSTPDQLAFLFRHMACLYTWDCWSQTNVDAILCGCVPFFINYNPFSYEEVDASELGIIPRLDGDHREFDVQKFMKQRLDMIMRITSLQASWEDRVRHFLAKMSRHFP